MSHINEGSWPNFTPKLDNKKLNKVKSDNLPSTQSNAGKDVADIENHSDTSFKGISNELDLLSKQNIAFVRKSNVNHQKSFDINQITQNNPALLNSVSNFLASNSPEKLAFKSVVYEKVFNKETKKGNPDALFKAFDIAEAAVKEFKA